MNPVQNYLALQGSYGDLFGLRWSDHDNSLEFANGGGFAFAEEIAEFLEGFAGVRPIIHFAFMVHLLLLLRQAPDKSVAASSQRRRLWQLYFDKGKSLRNAGAFCGRLCHNIPAAREAKHLQEICLRLRSREPLHGFLIEQGNDTGKFIYLVAHGYDPPEFPPFDPAVFEGSVKDVFQTCSDEEALFWFQHGRGPIQDVGTTLAQALPGTLSGRLANLLERPRLARARAWVSQLIGALTLPPRRLAQQDLPIGGYADVTTRGQVDQILPSQFALDEWDFFRRYAEHELLYFRREDPHDQTRQELVVVLDQGVRTWGDVRLVLGAALLALGKQAIQRGYSFLLATTSADMLDPLHVDEESLGQIVETSDWSAHPGLALEQVLEEPAAKNRDIVLLTHSRNLNEEDVRAAAKRLRPGVRLFALTLDRHGQAELGEFKHGTPVSLRQFHVDFTLAPANAEPSPAPMPEVGGWSGDVEPIGFPFRFGVAGTIGAKSFDFDLTDKFLLTAGPHGTLHLWEVGGGLVEILPRGMWQGKILNAGMAGVLGVADGFVVTGTIGPRTVAMHYNLESRTCTCHLVGDGTAAFWNFEYSQQHHCLIAYGGLSGFTVDLTTGECFATQLGGKNNRAQEAWKAWERRQISPRQLGIGNTWNTSNASPSSFVYLDPDTGKVKVMAGPMRMDPLSGQPHSAWVTPFMPLSDGQPMLRDQIAIAAQIGGLNLALLASRLGSGKVIRLHLIRGPEGIPLGEHNVSQLKHGFRLSASGELLARQIGASMVEVSQVAGSVAPLGRTRVGGFTQDLPFRLSDNSLLLRPGSNTFCLDWSLGKLDQQFYFRDHPPWDPTSYVLGHPGEVPEWLKNDPARWLLGARKKIWAASDRYGQVALFDQRQNLICMFFAFRNRLAGWMPDGTRFGPANITGKPPSSDFAALFGRALQEASR